MLAVLCSSSLSSSGDAFFKLSTTRALPAARPLSPHVNLATSPQISDSIDWEQMGFARAVRIRHTSAEPAPATPIDLSAACDSQPDGCDWNEMGAALLLRSPPSPKRAAAVSVDLAPRGIGRAVAGILGKRRPRRDAERVRDLRFAYAVGVEEKRRLGL